MELLAALYAATWRPSGVGGIPYKKKDKKKRKLKKKEKSNMRKNSPLTRHWYEFISFPFH